MIYTNGVHSLPDDRLRLSREEMESRFEPCPVCGEIEKEVATGVYRITHRYDLHGLERLKEYEKCADDLGAILDPNSENPLGVSEARMEK